MSPTSLRRLGAACLWLSARLCLAQTPGVELERVPDGGIQPQTAVDQSGIVYLVYFKGDPAGVMSRESFAQGPHGTFGAWETDKQVRFGRIEGGRASVGVVAQDSASQKYPSPTATGCSKSYTDRREPSQT